MAALLEVVLLSYRHSFHAGNFADVLKHVVLVEILDYLTRKESAFDYIDTHAGAGLFNLQSADAVKLAEYADGIGRLAARDFPELARYLEVIYSFNSTFSLSVYPGSPAIAGYFLRPQDRAWLYELHPQDYKQLSRNMQSRRRVRVANEDGLKGLLGLLPPVSRRALVHIDPSYEIKADYDHVVEVLVKAHKKFATGVYALWYPVVERPRIVEMERKLLRSGIQNVHRFELGVAADSDSRGMTAAGMFIINPPWTLPERMSAILPRLSQILSVDGKHSFKCEVISNL